MVFSVYSYSSNGLDMLQVLIHFFVLVVATNTQSNQRFQPSSYTRPTDQRPFAVYGLPTSGGVVQRIEGSSFQEIRPSQKTFSSRPSTTTKLSSNTPFVPNNQQVNQNPFVPNNQFVNRNQFVSNNQQVNQNKFVSNNQFVNRNQFVSNNQQVNQNRFPPNNQFVNRNQFVSNNQQVNQNKFVSSNQFVNRNQFVSNNQQVNQNQVLPNNQFVNRNQFVSNNQQVNQNQVLPNNQFVNQNPFAFNNQQVNRNPFAPNNQFANQNPFAFNNQQVNQNTFASNNQFVNQKPFSSNNQQVPQTPSTFNSPQNLFVANNQQIPVTDIGTQSISRPSLVGGNQQVGSQKPGTFVPFVSLQTASSGITGTSATNQVTSTNNGQTLFVSSSTIDRPQSGTNSPKPTSIVAVSNVQTSGPFKPGMFVPLVSVETATTGNNVNNQAVLTNYVSSRLPESTSLIDRPQSGSEKPVTPGSKPTVVGPFKPGTFVPLVPVEFATTNVPIRPSTGTDTSTSSVSNQVGVSTDNRPSRLPITSSARPNVGTSNLGSFKPGTFVPSVPVELVIDGRPEMSPPVPPVLQAPSPLVITQTTTQTASPVTVPSSTTPEPSSQGSTETTQKTTPIKSSSKPQKSPPGFSFNILGSLDLFKPRPSSKPTSSKQPLISFLAEFSASKKNKAPSIPIVGFKPPDSELNIQPLEPSGPFLSLRSQTPESLESFPLREFYPSSVKPFNRPAKMYGLPENI